MTVCRLLQLLSIRRFREEVRMPLKNMLADKDAEKNGVYFIYDEDTRIKASRAGGSNAQYFKVLNRLSKGVRRALDQGMLSEARTRKLLQEVYAESVVKEWHTLRQIDGKKAWLPGIDGSWGAPAELLNEHGLLKFTPENVLLTFEAVPDLWEDLNKFAQMLASYRKEELETEAKNS